MVEDTIKCMVGGIVSEIIKIYNKENLYWIEVCEHNRPKIKCGVYAIIPNHYELKPGDSLWWQSNKHFWTPKNTFDIRRPFNKFDIELDRCGCSGVNRPSNFFIGPNGEARHLI